MPREVNSDFPNLMTQTREEKVYVHCREEYASDHRTAPLHFLH
jgi:hypothetical protein